MTIIAINPTCYCSSVTHRYQVLHHVHVRQRIDLGGLVQVRIVDLRDTGQRVRTADVHRARAADALTAGSSEGERRVDLILDLDQRVQYHRTARVEVDLVGLHVRLRLAFRVL